MDEGPAPRGAGPFFVGRRGASGGRRPQAGWPITAAEATISVAIGDSACDAAFAAIAHARRNGVRISFDTNLRLKLWPLARARAVMTEVLRLTDICLPSWDDVTVLTGLDDRDAIVDWLLVQGARVVALKLGRAGAYVATPDERRVVPGCAAPSSMRRAGGRGGG